MVCLSPLEAYYSKELNRTGKRSLVFDKREALSGVPINVSCGQCIGCRLQKSLDWAVRCVHEKSLHEESSFVTLTYDDEHLPKNGSLVYRDFQLFMKRYRKITGSGVRFLMCGEYGDRNMRPHYHVLFFNRDFADKRYYKTSSNGDKLYNSDLLSELWPFGFNVVAALTFESAAYVTRYVTKKVTGDKAAAHYGDRVPEFIKMSLKPGIGSGWLEKYGKQAYTHDFVVLDGRKCKLPRFYDTKYEVVDNARVEVLKRSRVTKAKFREKELKARVKKSGLFNTYNARNMVLRASLLKRDPDYEA